MYTTPQSPVIPIPMEDAIIHTDEHPYCDDPACPCNDELAEQLERAEWRFLQIGMTESYDALPWRYGD